MRGRPLCSAMPEPAAEISEEVSVNAPSFQMPTLSERSVLLTGDGVRILDRRVFPFQVIYVDCPGVEEVAKAIEDMVTQSGGPFLAAGAGMVLAARDAAGHASADDRMAAMNEAGRRLIATRPTNDHIAKVVAALLADARSLAPREDFAQAMERSMERLWEERRQRNRLLGRYAAECIEDGDAILTHCWAESSIVETLAAVLRQGKKIKVLCTETRPYLQGSRLTAHSVAEMGIDVTVITDNMGASAMSLGKVSRYMTAADRVTMSGHVINKVGTLQLALAARAYDIPYIAMVQAPDRGAPGPEHVVMEERDPEESLHCLGMRTASPLVRQGWYPAFDVTPPHLVSAVATSKGMFPAGALDRFYDA